MQASDFFSAEEKKIIVQAVKDAELNTSGEIRVHIESSFSGNVLDRAATVFASLNMHKTKLRNGVLVYFAIKNKQFAILGDAGINQVVPGDFWNQTKDLMADYFKRSEFANGLAAGIRTAGEQLKHHFPFQKDDVNELSDDLSFDTSE